jgi:hypothetical protein
LVGFLKDEYLKKKSSGPITGRNNVPRSQTSLLMPSSLLVTNIIIQEIRNKGNPEKMTICQNIRPTVGVIVSIWVGLGLIIVVAN